MVQEGLNNRIALVAGGTGLIGSGVVQALLQHGATVIVPAPDAASLQALRAVTPPAAAGRLITYPTDIIDYEQAAALIDIIVSEYGHIDLVISAMEPDNEPTPLLCADIREWCKAMDFSVTASFVIDRLCLPLLGRNGGMLISISDADHLLPDAASPLARLSGLAGIELSRIFAAEARPRQIHYYHLLVNNVAPVAAPVSTGGQSITPDMIGGEVVRLYSAPSSLQDQTFRFFTGKPLGADLLNRLNT